MYIKHTCVVGCQGDSFRTDRSDSTAGTTDQLSRHATVKKNMNRFVSTLSIISLSLVSIVTLTTIYAVFISVHKHIFVFVYIMHSYDVSIVNLIVHTFTLNTWVDILNSSFEPHAVFNSCYEDKL